MNPTYVCWNCGEEAVRGVPHACDTEPIACTCGSLTGVHDLDCTPIPAAVREALEDGLQDG